MLITPAHNQSNLSLPNDLISGDRAVNDRNSMKVAMPDARLEAAENNYKSSRLSKRKMPHNPERRAVMNGQSGAWRRTRGVRRKTKRHVGAQPGGRRNVWRVKCEATIIEKAYPFARSVFDAAVENGLGSGIAQASAYRNQRNDVILVTRKSRQI